jgi:hypothetical protein
MVSGTINDRPPQLCGGTRVRKKDDLKIIEGVVVDVYSRYVSLKTCETNVPFTIAVGDLPNEYSEALKAPVRGNRSHLSDDRKSSAVLLPERRSRR